METPAAGPPANRYHVPVDALERSAHVPRDEQVTQAPAGPPDLGPWHGELFEREHDALRAGG